MQYGSGSMGRRLQIYSITLKARASKTLGYSAPERDISRSCSTPTPLFGIFQHVVRPTYPRTREAGY